MTLKLEPHDVWEEFAETAPSVIRRTINERVYHMAGANYSTERIKTAIEVMQGPLPPCYQMDEEMMEQLIASKRKAKYEPPSPRHSRTNGIPPQAMFRM